MSTRSSARGYDASHPLDLSQVGIEARHLDVHCHLGSLWTPGAAHLPKLASQLSVLPTGCATRLKGENVAPSSPGLASTHSIERRPLSTAQGCKDVTGSIIQRAKCHNARIHVAADRNTNILKLYRHPFFRRRISPQKQL